MSIGAGNQAPSSRPTLRRPAVLVCVVVLLIVVGYFALGMPGMDHSPSGSRMPAMDH
ncbi:hypothetical protein [Iamia sp.]|uniref:hypothetical protein n=1 Tax=Iamia sp. TaxID=2722710 RepID=UPI002B51FFE5|nr:hypothetical protein [Iamia sp.]HXH58056.1 hypothetical protein [Iamia sp.]